MNDFVTSREVCRLLGIPDATLRGWKARGLVEVVERPGTRGEGQLYCLKDCIARYKGLVQLGLAEPLEKFRERLDEVIELEKNNE